MLCHITCADVRSEAYTLKIAPFRKVHFCVITLGSQIDGKDWQNFCIDLLYLRYGANLVDVPDKHKGDGGIEAYSLDGDAFQCYAPEGINTVAQTAEIQVQGERAYPASAL